MEGKKLYEDDKVVAFLNPRPAAAGHIILFPKEHLPILENVKDYDVAHMFTVANKLSTAAFESLNAQGTNIIIQNGTAAGQKVPHVAMHIIPRRENDNLDFKWKPKQMDEEKKSTVEQQLKDETSSIGEFEKKKEKPLEVDKPKEVQKGDNYLVKQLRRIP
jgi:histidine triad (HIT) family protein